LTWIFFDLTRRDFFDPNYWILDLPDPDVADPTFPNPGNKKMTQFNPG